MVAEGQVLAIEADEEQSEDHDHQDRDAKKDHDEEKVGLLRAGLLNFHAS